MILAAHQANFIPWLPFFSKMEQSDVFILMINVQFEKNGWQNRCQVNGNYWTMPVEGGTLPINQKRYVGGQNLVMINTQWINSMAVTLGINTGKIRYDIPTNKNGTDRIIELCKHYSCDQYLTNPSAMEKYLDEKSMNDEGIEVIHHKFEHKIHVFEAFDKWGIEKTRRLIKRRVEGVPN